MRTARAVVPLGESGANSAGEIEDGFSCRRRDASAWPPFWLILDYKHTVGKRDTETMGRIVAQRFRPT